MAYRLPGLKFRQRAQSFEFQIIKVRKQLEVAAEIRVSSAFDHPSAFYEKKSFPVVRSPFARIVDSTHLLGETSLRVRVVAQLNELAPESPPAIGKVGIRPDGEMADREQVIIIDRRPGRKRQNGASAAFHHRGPPCRKLNSNGSHIRDSMLNARLGGGPHLYLDSLYQFPPVQTALYRRCERDTARGFTHRDWIVVRVIGALPFWSNPQAMSTVEPEIVTTAKSVLVVDVMELVLAAAKAVRDNTRSDVCQNNGFDGPIGDAATIFPAAVIYALEHGLAVFRLPR